MMKKRLFFLFSFLLAMTMFAGSVFAFTDIHDDKGKADILALKEAGIVSGVTAELFAPRGKVSYAQGIQMLVKGFDLKAEPSRNGKIPKASDIFANVKDNAWYADAFVAAHLNGLPIPKDVKPNEKMTKEQFAHLLFNAILSKGDFAFIELYVMMEDEKDVSPEMMESIQKLLVAKIAQLDNGYFYPKKEITRSEAAQMLHKAIRFVKTVEPIPPLEPPVDPGVTMSVSKVNDEVNKVTVSWGEKPNPGYRISISKIEFTDNGEAVIYYMLHEPEPGKMYPQVITEAKTHTFISAEYEPVLKNGSSDNAGNVRGSATGSVDGSASAGGGSAGFSGGLDPHAPVSSQTAVQ
mgnify:CR=1 FL=1